MKPKEILAMKADLQARLNGPRFSAYIGRCASLDTQGSLSQLIPANLSAQLRQAEVFRVDETMSRVLIAAAEGLDESDLVFRDLAPSESGIVRFETPLPMRDIRGTIMKVHWLTWGQVYKTSTTALGVPTRDAATMITMWNDNRDPDGASDYINDQETYTDGDRARFTDTIGRWAWVSLDLIVDGEMVGTPLLDLDQETIDRVLADGDIPTAMTNATRYVHALWLLLGQTITRTTREPAALPPKKGVKRRPLPPQVTVVRLRSEVAPTQGGTREVEWSSRWLVRSHWAWRSCGKDHPQAQPYDKGYRVRLFLNGYVKNAHRTDLPLTCPVKIYDLVR